MTTARLIDDPCADALHAVRRALPERPADLVLVGVGVAGRLIAREVHFREHVADGVRVGEAQDGQAAQALLARPAPTVVVRGASAPTKAERALALQVISRQDPFWVVRMDDASHQATLVRDDGNVAVDLAERFAHEGGADVEVEGDGSFQAHAPLPLRLVISTPVGRGLLDVRVKAAGRAVREARLHVVTPSNAPPTFELAVDLECELGRPDRVRFAATDGYDLRSALEPKHTAGTRAQQRRRVHLVLDRTTADPDAWASSCDQRTDQDQASAFGDAATAEEDGGRTSLNVQTRALVGRELERSLSENTRVVVSWFADVPRADGMSKSQFASSPVPWGWVGDVDASHIARVLSGVEFDHVSGFDLPDCLDEVLAAVLAEEQEARNASEPSLVLIVGDSPPPPTALHDPLWELLAEGPSRTDMRLGSDVTGTLAALAQLGARVAYVYLRPPDRERDADAAAPGYLDYLEMHARSLEALRRLPLDVFPADRTPESLHAALAGALALRAPSSQPTPMRVLALLQGSGL